MSNLFDIQNRVAVVTGASSGIGLAIGGVLAEAGAKVVLLARRAAMLECAAEKLAVQGGHANWVAANLLDRESYQRVFEQICVCFGAPQIVVNAAGVNLRQPTGQVDWNGWDATLNLNLSAPFFFSRMFIDSMIDCGWGKIINIASLQSYRAFANSIAYGASKGGVTQLTRAMAESWSRHGISCNAIAPGFFKTELTAPVFADSALAEQMAQKTAMERNGQMDDLTGPVLFLCSSASDYVTGQILCVDGGFTAK